MPALLRRRPEFPLLTRELVEQSVRPRTYIMRLAYAVVLFVMFSFMLYARFASGSTALHDGPDPLLAMTGQGRDIFDWVIGMQVLGVAVFLPAMMADAVTRERERGALDLLLTTELRPWDIVLQKLLSRLIPLATILMISLPLLAVAYAYGGIETARLWACIVGVGLFAAQLGAIALCVSVDAPKTSSAMLSAYIRAPLIVLVLAMVGGLVGFAWRWMIQVAGLAIGEILKGGMVSGATAQNVAAMFDTGGALGYECLTPFALAWVDPAPAPLAVVLLTLPAAASVVYYLKRTRDRLADVMTRNPADRPVAAFELADVPRQRRQRVHQTLPVDRPIVWMDRTGHLYTQLKKVFIVAILVDLPIFLWLAASMAYDGDTGQRPGLAVLTCAAFAVATPIIAMIAASAFAAERTGQTLEVLLTTPMSTRQLIREKATSARTFAWMCLVPVAAAVGIEYWLESIRLPRGATASGNTLSALIVSLGCAAIYLPLAMWYGLWIGMVVRDRARAILAVLLTFGVLVGVVPMLAGSAIAAFGESVGTPVYALRLLSPAALLWVNESGAWEALLPGERWVWITLNFLLWGGLLVGVRWLCLTRADRHLGRVSDAPRPPRAVRTVEIPETTA